MKFRQIWLLGIILACTHHNTHAMGDTILNEKPFVLGKILTLQSKILKENRILNIYLPEGYSDTIAYPVTYLLDGSADEDFIHIAGLYQFYSFSWVQKVPPTIVVGIANVDRKRDFTFPTSYPEDLEKWPTSGHSDSFIAFIENELKPFIETKFKTNGNNTFIGESLGGLLATEILLSKPYLFNHYLIVSPSIWWDNASLLSKPVHSDFAKIIQSRHVYLAVGKEGTTPGKMPRIMETDARLLAEKIQGFGPVDKHFQFEYLPDENHATIMHKAVMNGLLFFGLE